MKDKYYVVIAQINYEYYDCDSNTSNPVGDMVDHNYDLPYKYVVRDVDENDIEEFDSFEEAKKFAKNMSNHDKLNIKWCSERNMYGIVKYDGYNDEWKDMHIYADYPKHLEEIIKMTEK